MVTRVAERTRRSNPPSGSALARDCGLPTQPGHMPLLTALFRHGSLGVSEAANLTGVSQPAIPRIARQVCQLGLV